MNKQLNHLISILPIILVKGWKEIVEITTPNEDVELIEKENINQPEIKPPSIDEAKFYIERLEFFFDNSEYSDPKNIASIYDLRNKLNDIKELKKSQRKIKNYFK